MAIILVWYTYSASPVRLLNFSLWILLKLSRLEISMPHSWVTPILFDLKVIFRSVLLKSLS